ncbi:hypothetical protein AXG93_773s1280 [Marchantia polymorpha subsp. ruderalis]|uniref:Uncharacterized protein n=1 Tax=Marchantia polymorpha subsp. ruderalis TaxID=1480154 RepID=A0A176WA29_MARPO|nr:hypothetical protein AXG93_773s1280 [Marchantia polymorpha subsp. ruderalis]
MTMGIIGEGPSWAIAICLPSVAIPSPSNSAIQIICVLGTRSAVLSNSVTAECDFEPTFDPAVDATTAISAPSNLESVRDLVTKGGPDQPTRYQHPTQAPKAKDSWMSMLTTVVRAREGRVVGGRCKISPPSLEIRVQETARDRHFAGADASHADLTSRGGAHHGRHSTERVSPNMELTTGHGHGTPALSNTLPKIVFKLLQRPQGRDLADDDDDDD